MKINEATRLIRDRIFAIFATRGRVFVAIDGRCASGKTTLAKGLAESLPATVLHADDFFLRPEQRTEARLSEIGGNLDRERLEAELLIPLTEGRTATYRPFDCSQMTLAEPRTVSPAPIVILEGSYTHHPELRKYYDLRIFLDTPPTLQWERIEKRESPASAMRFRDRWIPMEERYIEGTRPEAAADLVISIN